MHDGTKAYGAYANMEKHFGNPELAYVIPEISVDEFDDWLMTDLDRRVHLFGHNWFTMFQLPGSFHLSFFVIFGDKVTKISCHFQAKTVQLFFSFFVIYEKRKWDETLIRIKIDFKNDNITVIFIKKCQFVLQKTMANR